MASYTKKELADFNKSIAAEERLNKFIAKRQELIDDVNTGYQNLGRELKEQLKTEEGLNSVISNILGTEKQMVALNEKKKELGENATEEQLKKFDLDRQAVMASNDMVKGIQSQLSGVQSLVMGAKNFITVLMANPFIALAAAALFLVKILFDIAKGAMETRKELGTSLMLSAKLEVQTRALALAGKVYGLEVENIKAAQTAIRNELGLSVQEAANLSLQFAKTAAVTGQNEEQLAKTLSIMESISDASRDALLSQIETTGQMLEMQGLAPGEIFQDVADNAEHFATFAKDGGMNVIKAAAAAKKLGLNMSAVASTTESLLDFESSIEKQMEASMLLGREINLDKARQLAFMDDQEGMMKEILKQVGGEAEFSKLVGTQRKVLAESVGLNVEQLSRLVRNNTATTTGKAVTAGAKTGDSTEELLTDHTQLFQSMNKSLKSIAAD
jgi:plasmid maintenance system antidote protein VapI